VLITDLLSTFGTFPTLQNARFTPDVVGMLDTLVKTVHTLSRNREWLVFTIFDLPL